MVEIKQLPQKRKEVKGFDRSLNSLPTWKSISSKSDLRVPSVIPMLLLMGWLAATYQYEMLFDKALICSAIIFCLLFVREVGESNTTNK